MIMLDLLSNTNVITIAVLTGLIVAFLLPEKIHFFLDGLILLSVGTVQILNHFGYIDFVIRETPLFTFAITFVMAITAEELLSESIREKGLVMQSLTFLTGVGIMLLIITPELYHLGVINFNFPEYPIIIDSIIYTVSGLIAVLAPWFAY